MIHYLYKVRVLCTWVSKSDLSSYGRRIRRSLWWRRNTCLSSFYRVLVTCMNSWYYNSKYTLNRMRTLREQFFFIFFLSDVILSQRDVWKTAKNMRDLPSTLSRQTKLIIICTAAVSICNSLTMGWWGSANWQAREDRIDVRHCWATRTGLQ